MEKLKNKQITPETQKYQEGTYEILLYNLLTEFQDYPKELQKILLVVAAFLLDIYDLVLKIHEDDKLEDEDKTHIKNFQDSDIEKFQ